jgi:single-strand DNA-binding protein
MKSLNKFMGIGNIGKEPELRFMANGQPVLNFSIAMTVKVTNNDGESRELTEWMDVTIFGKLAETMNQYLSTGKAVFVEGHLHTRTWHNDEKDVTMYRTGIIAQNIIILTPKAAAEYSGEGDPEADNGVELEVDNVEAAAALVKPAPATPKAAPAKAAPAKAAPAKAAPKAAARRVQNDEIPF